MRKIIRDVRGSASVFIICLLPMFLALGGLAIDGANAWRMRAIMQTTADAASLAAVMDLPDEDQALASAQAYAAKNMPTAANGAVLATADVFIGKWDSDTRTFTPGAVPKNAVQATVRRSSANSNPLPTSFLNLIGVAKWDIVTTAISTKAVNNLWVSLVLDNTGSMCQPGTANPCPTPVSNSKILALRVATKQLLDTLEAASVNPGDVMASIVPFAKDVNVGVANVNAGWIDWTDWEAPPPNGTPSSSVGPGSSCPYSTSDEGYVCQSTPVNASSSTSAIPSSGAYAGYVCPGRDNGSDNDGRKDRYYNGCYDSVPWSCTGSSCSCSAHSSCSCAGSGSNKTCQGAPFAHNWIKNAHGTWTGCVMDRNQANDIGVTAPISTATNFPAENALSCVPSQMAELSSDWEALRAKATAMNAAGATNQTVGLAWGWQTMTQGAPMNAPEPPQNLRRVMILLSDGLNTQNRWNGNGSAQSPDVDARMAAACANAKADGIKIYTVFVDLAGTTGNSTVLQNCASEPSMYFDLTTSGAIITTLNDIGQKITTHRVVY